MIYDMLTDGARHRPSEERGSRKELNRNI